MSKEQSFFEKYAPLAMEQQQKYGIPASVTLAQAALESGWGESQLTREDKNFFGIHAVPAWIKRGDPVAVYNDGGRVPFTKHADARESFEYHSKFLLLNSRQYGSCYSLSPTDSEGWAKGIARGGYAQDGSYYTKLSGCIEKYDLKKYDEMAMMDAQNKNISVGSQRGTLSMEPVRPAGTTAAAAPAPNVAVSGSNNGYGYPVHEPLVLTDYYGRSATSYRNHTHNGIDLRANNIPVFATESQGKVIGTGYDSKSGNFVKVEYERSDGAKWQVSYCHLSSVSVQKGQVVDADTQLGVSGMTGNSTAPHLHLTVKRVDPGSQAPRTVNPLDYLAEVSVRGGLDGTVTDKSTGKDLLADRKGRVDTQPTPADVYLAQQRGQQDVQDQQAHANGNDNLLAGNQQQAAAAGQGGLVSALFGRSMKDTDGATGLDASSGDLFADLFAAIVAGTVAMIAKVNGLTEQQVHDEMNQKGEADENKKYDATIDPTIVDRLRAEGVDSKEMKNMTQMNAEAQLAELDQQKQQQRGLTMG